ncbi:MAG: hypothetical protein WA941_18135 [Nitrososphaeraceae archaeon]|jgi:hypothetical protein
MLPKCIEKNQQQLQPKLSTIFKLKVIDTSQAFGSFYDPNGEKYCAVSILSKYLGYDIATVSKEIQNGENSNPEELIPSAILEIIENFCEDDNHNKFLRCFCSRPDYYSCYSLISLLIHLNDYHKMTFIQIGNWLESKGM